MTTYRISAPNGKTYQIEGPPGATREQVIQAVLAQAPEAGQAPETTFLGQVGEAFKGVIPGAIGLVEQAAIGASALLPQEQERAAREAIAGVAGAAKAPFAPAPGYEGTVARKFGEAAGSFIPFLGLGPLGLAGRAGAVGLGVGAGAGEARTRAETEGATEEQRAAATALGTIPGALEVFAPFRILSRIPEGEVLTAVTRLKRVALAGGEEAAQEAASGLAQNMIARGIYKPDQALIEGLGEQAAYGGAVGGLAQGLLDLALGRRARGAGAGEPAPPEGQTAIDIVKAQREQAKAEQEAARQMPPLPETYAELIRYSEEVKQLPKSKERTAALKAASEKRKALVIDEINANRLSAEQAKRFLTAEEAEQAEIVRREEFVPPAVETSAAAPEAKPAPGFVRVYHSGSKGEGDSGRWVSTNKQYAADYRKDLPLFYTDIPANDPRVNNLDYPEQGLKQGFTFNFELTPEEATRLQEIPRPETVEEPKVRKAGVPAPLPDILDSATVAKIGFTRGSIHNMLVGKAPTDPEVRDVLQTYLDAKREEGTLNPKTEAKVNAFLARLPEPTVPTATVAPPVAAAPEPTPPVAAAPEPTPPVAAAPEPETPSAVEPVEQPSGAGAPVAGEPSAGATPAGAGEAEPTGVVRPIEDAGQPVVREGEQPTAVAPSAIAETMAPARGEYEPPVKAGLKPKREAELRAKLAQQRKELEILETARDKAEGNIYLAEITGNEEAKTRAVDAHEAARLVLKKAVSSAERTYNQLFDAEKADFEAAIGEAYVADLLAEREAKREAARALKSREGQGLYPYNLTSAEAVREELRDQTSHLPGYKELIEKYFTPDNKLRKGKVEEQFVAEGQKFLDRSVLYRTIPQTPLVQGAISNAQLRKIVADIERALGGEADITILDDVTDLDNKQAPGSRAGALQGGKIYLFRSGIADGVEGQKTIFHEVFHKGLANLLSPAEYRALMTKFYNQSTAVRQAADAYLASETGKKDTEGMSPEEGRVLAVEEVLAEMAEATKLTGSTLRQLGNFFARVADRFNMPVLARAIRTMGLNPLQAFIRDAIQAGIKPSTATGRTRYRSLVGEKEERTLGEKLNAKFGGNKAIGFRAQAMDLLAGVDYIFTKAYGNRIRDNRGDYNPVFLMSRALDAPRFAKEVQEFGTMRRDPTGLLSVDTLKYKDEDISYKQVLESIAAEAKARGVNPETFLKDIGESLAAHREYELMNDPQVEKDIEFFLTPEEAKAAEAAFQADAFIKGVSEKLDAIRFALIDTMVDSGRITAEKAKEWKEATGYIPFSRIDEFDNLMQRPDAPSNVKLAAFKQIKQFKGSKERQTENPVTRFSNLMNWMVNESMKADAVGNALAEMELLGYAEFVAKPDAVDNNKRGALVPTYIKGQRKTFYVPDPANLAAFVGAPTNNIPAFIKGAQKFSQFLRVGVTATPPFAIKQVLDDITRAYVHSGVKNPGAMLPRILLNFPRNWWNEIKGTQSAAVKELAKSGVVPAYDTIVGDNVRDILQETGLAPRSVGKAIMRVMEAGAKASDVSVREAIFNQTMKETGDKALAELRAREIINFSRRGTARTTDYLIRTIPFFNAYARSMDKLLLAAAGSPSAQRTIGATTGYARNLFYKRMGVLTAMGFAYALLMSDDEEYQNLPDHVRDRNWILPGGKELGFVPAMPIPAELSFFFKAIPERVVQFYKLQGTPEERDGMRVLKELMLSGVDIFSSPNITPQVLKPILENLVNYSFFLGRPLESQAQLALDPSERYGTGTSEALKEVSKTMTDIATSTGIEALKVSPIMLENLVRGMFGMSAGIALSVADVMVNPTRTDRPLHQTIAAQLTGASAVMKDPVGMRYLDEIYNLDRSTEQVYNTYNRKLKSDPDDAEKYFKSNFGLYVARSEVRSTMEAIRELNAQARAIDKMTDLTPEERRLLINDLRTQQNDLARAVYRLRRQVAEEQRVMDASQ
jgi:hypothetical protein